MKSLASQVLWLLPLYGIATADMASDAISLKQGEQIYRQGITRDGSAIEANLAGDVPVDGSLFACANCHQRSGMGSVEGSVVAWPLAGRYLYEPRRRTGAWQPAPSIGKDAVQNASVNRKQLPSQFKAEHARPAFTRESLAHAIRTGELPNGEQLNRAMPRYQLDDNAMLALVDYLEDLSRVPDPGVTDSQIRFATVVSDGVPEIQRDAMLDVLKVIARSHSVQTRPHKRRASYGPFYKSQSYGAYREMQLDVWELTGSRETWGEQLQAYQDTQPVFALLGGMVEGDWSPIHAFSESQKIPTIFPVTDQPVIDNDDWYTLYFSKGYVQEGIAAARYLSGQDSSPATRIVHVYQHSTEGNLIADSFDDEWKRLTDQATHHSVLPATISVTEHKQWVSQWSENSTQGATTVLLWVNNEVLQSLLPVLESTELESALFVSSSSMLDREAELMPDSIRNRILFTLPVALPQENPGRYRAVQQWLRIRGIPETDIDIQARMYFLGWLLPGVLKSMRGEYYRDFFLESFDMMSDQDTAIALYPEVTFGAGQRYAAKGCYMAELAESEEDSDPGLVPVSSWIIH